MARQLTQQTDPYVDAAAIAADVFNVDFSLTSADALIAQLESAVPLVDEKQTARPGTTPARCDCPASPRFRASAGPYATASLAAQVLQENVAQLSELKPIEIVRDDSGCDYRTIVPLVRSTTAAIVRELSKLEPLADRVNSYLKTLVAYDPANCPATLDPDTVGGDLGRLRDRFRSGGNACSVKDERAQLVYFGIVQFTNTLLQAWRQAQQLDDKSLSMATYSLQRDFRAIAGTVERLHHEVPSSVWATYQLRADPPVLASDLYLWIRDYASVGALNDLKQSGMDGIRNVNTTFTDIETLVHDTMQPAASPPNDACNAAFLEDEAQVIVQELICHIRRVITVTAKLLG